jgi:hypothetical protein
MITITDMQPSSTATWLGYPEPQDTASIPRLTAQEAAETLRREQGSAQKTLLLIDVRRSDLTVSEAILESWSEDAEKKMSGRAIRYEAL